MRHVVVWGWGVMEGARIPGPAAGQETIVAPCVVDMVGLVVAAGVVRVVDGVEGVAAGVAVWWMRRASWWRQRCPVVDAAGVVVAVEGWSVVDVASVIVEAGVVCVVDAAGVVAAAGVPRVVDAASVVVAAEVARVVDAEAGDAATASNRGSWGSRSASESAAASGKTSARSSPAPPPESSLLEGPVVVDEVGGADTPVVLESGKRKRGCWLEESLSLTALRPRRPLAAPGKAAGPL
ncbi:hypothetical protein CYMTET_2559 [Cymbomonas tetramitiformis]|uniref:Uncharacterized protein n=1 Tax=Cymbomonas tetramitiformis TaxID=36881 RepID=A0AAE0H4W9_9CHLO|nr:hypothetical protein CYMTET_2559 [Cymbomonas tetramitiformis]